MFQAGAFGGTYFRPIRSAITKQSYTGQWREFPAEWWAGLNIPKQVASPVYNAAVNRYGVACGQGLDAWEASGWITPHDPYGWVQWYARFFLGRRCDDDERQISRWAGVAGARGRWKGNLVAKVLAAEAGSGSGSRWDDPTVSPVVRQLLLHWAYHLSEADYAACAKRVRKHGAAYVPRASIPAAPAKAAAAAASSSGRATSREPGAPRTGRR